MVLSGCAHAEVGESMHKQLKCERVVRACVLTLLAGGVVGCGHVKPYERGRLAQPDMALAEDRDLDIGPDHALDYREGSAGGLGGNGGGCGCN